MLLLTDNADANQVFGSLVNGVHIASYSLERAFREIEWILEKDDRWQSVKPGFTDVNAFMKTVRLDKFAILADDRDRIAKRLKELQPDLSNKTIAGSIGSSPSSIDRAVRAPNGADDAKNHNTINDQADSPAPNDAPLVGRTGAEVIELNARKDAADARKEAKAEQRQELLEARFSATGPFDVVVIDPPWPMQKIDREVRPNQAEFAYDVMTLDEISQFWPNVIAPHIKKDCHLFCWTTHKFLPAAVQLVERWGFNYVLTMVWHKPGGFQPIGLPQYNCEFAIYARRGAPQFLDTKRFNVCNQWPRQEHSRKPADFYDLVRRVTGGSRIDVFSREPHEGFAQYGKEIGKFSESLGG